MGEKRKIAGKETIERNVPTLEKTDGDETFDKIGVLAPIAKVLSKKSIIRPTKLQSAALPHMMACKHVVVRAETGSGKTLSLLITLVHELWLAFDDHEFPNSNDPVTSAIFIVPNFELSQPIYDELEFLFGTYCMKPLVVALKSTMSSYELDALFRTTPDVIISTPDCVEKCFKRGLIKTEGVLRGFRCLIFDEIDRLQWIDYECTIRSIIAQVPEDCQCLFSCSDPSADVDRLRSLLNRNPRIITLPKSGDVKVEVFPYNVEQFYIRCSSRDKFPHFLALRLNKRILGKALIFTNSVHTCEKLQLLIQTFIIKTEVIVPGLQSDRLFFILEEFNAGRYDQLIILSNHKESKQRSGWEVGVMKGINFDIVDAVVNFDMPPTIDGYANRVTRAGRTRKLGGSISLVSPKEERILAEIKSSLGDEDSKIIAPWKSTTESKLEDCRRIMKNKKWAWSSKKKQVDLGLH